MKARRSSVLPAVVGLALMCAAPVAAEPAEAQQSDYPDVSHYSMLDTEDFTVPGSVGIWFLSTQGLNCGIWDQGGSFGCSGDIPGAPAGTTRIGWFRGDSRVHYDWTVGIRWPVGQAQRILPMHSSVHYNGTTCSAALDGTIRDGGIYCERGYFRFFITSAGTWLN